MDTTTTKDKLAKFGREFTLLLNRGLMYQKSHPIVQTSIDQVHKSAEVLLTKISPLVFILNRNQFYIDEEQLDPRINASRIATLFKSHKIQSISLEVGVSVGELNILVDIFSSLTMSMDAEQIKKTLFTRGAFNIKINHVLYKKVTEDDQIISREALKEVAPGIETDDSQSRKKFMDALLETVLTEEFANTLNIQSLMADPKLVSRNMIQADLAGARQAADEPPGSGSQPGTGTGSGTLGMEGSQKDSDPAVAGSGPGAQGAGAGMGPDDGGSGQGFGAGSGGAGAGAGSGPGGPEFGPGLGDGSGDGGLGQGFGMGDGSGAGAGSDLQEEGSPRGGAILGVIDGQGAHGPLLLRQLEIIQSEVQKQLMGQGDVSIEDLADAVFEMKRQFFEELQTQKALGVAYANEDAIVNNLNQLTDDVILQLIKEEYGDGKITTQRLAQIILRLIPEPQELKRLLPQIKTALIKAGMPLDVYLALIDDLKKVLENEDLTRILEESSEAIGVDSEELIDEFKRNPDQAAKLIYLASEINKGTGDESALADILVEYVEKMTTEAAMEAGKEGADGDEHLKKVVTNVESALLRQLGKLNVGDDVLERMEDRINSRMDTIIDKMRVEWLNVRAGTAHKEKPMRLSVLQTLEHSVTEDEELADILKTVRAKVEDGEIEENNFSQIDAEIMRQRKRIQKEAEAIEMPEGVLDPDELMFIVEKEIALANRYNAPFSAMAFSFVSAKPQVRALDAIVTKNAIMAAALELLTGTIREVDFIGQIGKNKMVAVLPMIAYPAAKSALRRVVNLLHSKPLKVNDVPVDLRVAGVVAQYDAERTPSAQAFARQLSNQLMDMVARVKNIQVLF